MSLAYFIVPERDVPGLECHVSGKSLAHVEEDVLDRMCAEAGARPLSEFFSEDPEQAAAICEQNEWEPPSAGFPPEAWFSAADGLRTVRALLERVGEIADAGVARDLRDFERVLLGLDRAGVGWHLAIDF